MIHFRGGGQGGDVLPMPAPSRSYVALAIGSDSEHDLVRVLNAQGGEGTLAPGVIMPVGQMSGSPDLELIRVGSQNWGVHVIGFECWEEVAAAPRRRSPWYQARAFGSDSGEVNDYLVPFFGRRHGRFALRPGGGDGVGLTIYGRKYTLIAGSPVYYETTLEANATYTAHTGFHIGGTDSEEIFDELRFEITTDAEETCRVWVDLVGELGE